MTNDNSYHLTAADDIRLGTCGIHGDRGYWLSLDLGPTPRNAEVTFHFASFAQLQQLGQAVGQAMHEITAEAKAMKADVMSRATELVETLPALEGPKRK